MRKTGTSLTGIHENPKKAVSFHRARGQTPRTSSVVEN
jgi:hypothetical protein